MKITIKGLIAGVMALVGVAMAVPEAQAMPVQPMSVAATEAPAAQVQPVYFYGYRRPYYRYGYGFRRPFYGYRRLYRPFGFRRFYGYRRPFYRYGYRRW